MIKISVGSSTPIDFMIDPGSDFDIFTQKDWETIEKESAVSRAFVYNPVKSPSCNAIAYGETPLKFSWSVEARLKSDSAKPSAFTKLWVARDGKVSLLSFNTARRMKLLEVGAEVNAIRGDPPRPYPCMPGVEVNFVLKEGAQPVCQNYYNVPAAYEQAAIERLREMEAMDVIEKYNGPSIWLSGMSAVPKGKAGDFRLVVYMRGPNKAILRQFYTLPTVDVMKVKLFGAKFFTKLDLSNAFYHLKLSDKAKELTTFMGPDGTYRYKRLVFGVNCAPEIFQKEMERIWTGIEGVIVYIDDFLVFAPTLEGLRKSTVKLEEALRLNNLTINTEKGEYERESLTFLGQELSGAGMDIGKSKVGDIKSF
jgi:hypothetical protein